MGISKVGTFKDRNLFRTLKEALVSAYGQKTATMMIKDVELDASSKGMDAIDILTERLQVLRAINAAQARNLVEKEGPQAILDSFAASHASKKEPLSGMTPDEVQKLAFYTSGEMIDKLSSTIVPYAEPKLASTKIDLGKNIEDMSEEELLKELEKLNEEIIEDLASDN